MLTASYLMFVWLGPKYMRNRKPYSLTTFMILYNLGCVLLSCYMLMELVLGTLDAGYNYIGCAIYNAKTIKDPKEIRVANAMWWYFFSKAIELMDTVLMVLRKKNRQITFLHVFHHATMLNIWWWVTTFIPGGLSFFGSALNCLVHIVMYSYYCLSAIPALKNKLWWKHYITRFQLIQFCCTLTHTLYSLSAPCDFPQWGQYLLASYMVLMLVLFTNFYIMSYVAKHKSHENGHVIKNGKAFHNGNGTQNGLRNGSKKHN
ncbi:Elongation of very long chain fatty acids protein 2 [Lamellibrachia satsuma]|nr:Elongation of very long chain fatty acids protein 2 [Lamellibrachia satsuma]